MKGAGVYTYASEAILSHDRFSTGRPAHSILEVDREEPAAQPPSPYSTTSPATATTGLPTGWTPTSHSPGPRLLRTPREPCRGPHAGRDPRPPSGASRDGSVQPARTWREIHVHAEAKDHGKKCAQDRHAVHVSGATGGYTERARRPLPPPRSPWSRP